MFYDVYKQLCFERNEKPYVVAKKLGLKSNSIVAQWQKGSTPRTDTLQRIADYFGVSVSYLREENENPVIQTDDEARRWAIEAIDQMSDADFEALAPILRRFADKSKAR